MISKNPKRTTDETRFADRTCHAGLSVAKVKSELSILLCSIFQFYHEPVEFSSVKRAVFHGFLGF